MNRKTTIGGALRYDLLAQQHRPHDDATIAREVRRLIEQGLTERDIATTLKLDLGAVRRAKGTSGALGAGANAAPKYR